jgi:hypothetical protein
MNPLRKQQPEQLIYKQLSEYLKRVHPDLLWRFDFAAGTKMTQGQVARHKQLNPHRGWPDFVLFKPSRNGWDGLVLEIKVHSPYKLDGCLKKDEHLEEQHAMLARFNEVGYYAAFAVGIEDCIAKIEKYLSI